MQQSLKASRNNWCPWCWAHQCTQRRRKAEICTPRQNSFAVCFDVPCPEAIMAKSDSGHAQEEANRQKGISPDLRVFCSSSTPMVILSCCLLNTLTKLFIRVKSYCPVRAFSVEHRFQSLFLDESILVSGGFKWVAFIFTLWHYYYNIIIASTFFRKPLESSVFWLFYFWLAK